MNQSQALTLAHRHSARQGPTCDSNRNAYAIQPGHVGNSSNSKTRKKWNEFLEGVCRVANPLDSAAKHFQVDSVLRVDDLSNRVRGEAMDPGSSIVP